MSEIHQYKLRNGSSPAWYDEGTGPTPDAWHLDCVQPDHIWRTVYQQGHEAALSQPAGVADGWRDFPYSAAWCDGLIATLQECGEYTAAKQIAEIKNWAAAPAASGGDGTSPSLKQIVPAEKRNYLDDNGNPHSIEDEAYSLGWNACRSATLKAIAKSKAYPQPPPAASVSGIDAFMSKWSWLILARCTDEFRADLHALSSPRQEGGSTAASTQGLRELVQRWRTKKTGLSALGCANELELKLESLLTSPTTGAEGDGE